MLWLLIFLVIVIVAVSLIADYKWRRWLAERKDERDRQ
jgi:hypothetical protein